MRSTPHDAPADISSVGRLRFTSEGVVWLMIALVLGVAGWYKSLNLVLILAYSMGVLLFLNGALARSHARRARATRTPLPPLFAGEIGRAVVTVKNTTGGTATVGVTDQFGDAANTWVLHRLAPGGELTCAEQRAFPRRGRFRGPPLLVWSGFPFGLLRYDQPADAGGEVAVLPRPGIADADAMRRWFLRRAGGDGRSRKVLRRVTTDQADVRGVRPYRPGDSIRSVHWRSSARRGELMVREYDAAPSPELVLVVEPWLPEDPTKEQTAGLEAALSLAATVARVWCHNFATRITVVVAGRQTAVRSGPPTESFVRESLIPLADAKGRADFAAIRPDVFDRTLGQAARVVVSSRRGGALAAALARSTGRAFLSLDAATPLPWYQGPGVRRQESGVRRESGTK
ncbi:MAG TPA: DUF58 domain-containing protein [Gemmataceae bacterium]|nr:DUF58 domain-containing protein [Gemmataceae bacterium]